VQVFGASGIGSLAESRRLVLSVNRDSLVAGEDDGLQSRSHVWRDGDRGIGRAHSESQRYGDPPPIWADTAPALPDDNLGLLLDSDSASGRIDVMPFEPEEFSKEFAVIDRRRPSSISHSGVPVRTVPEPWGVILQRCPTI
jgi:hypothetical protein